MSEDKSKIERELATESIKNRLLRVEGQIRGIRRMLDEDSCCKDVLVQISAVRAAVSKVGVLILENHMKECLSCKDNGRKEYDEVAVEELLSVLKSFIR